MWLYWKWFEIGLLFEAQDKLPDLGIDVTELNFNIDGKVHSSGERRKRENIENAMIEHIWYRNSPQIPSGPTDQSLLRAKSSLKTSSKEKLLGKSNF